MRPHATYANPPTNAHKSLTTINPQQQQVHSSWHPEGFLHKWGVIDFAGGLGACVPNTNTRGPLD